MSEFEFRGTPGPWRTISSKVHIVSDNGPGNVVVCRTGLYGQQGEEIKGTRDRWEADAQLIAAAPLMLSLIANRGLLGDNVFVKFLDAMERHDGKELRDLWDYVQS